MSDDWLFELMMIIIDNADHIFIQIYFRMHHFVVKFSKFSSPQAARGHWPPNQNPADPPVPVHVGVDRYLPQTPVLSSKPARPPLLQYIDRTDGRTDTGRLHTPCCVYKGVRRILVRGVNVPLPPEAKTILKMWLRNCAFIDFPGGGSPDPLYPYVRTPMSLYY